MIQVNTIFFNVFAELNKVIDIEINDKVNNSNLIFHSNFIIVESDYKLNVIKYKFSTKQM